MNIYVGNLARDVTDHDLKKAFEVFGQISSVKVVKDKRSGEPRGFGFVEMPSNEEAQSAIKELNGSDFKGTNLNVNEARPRPDKPHSGNR